MRNNRLVTMIVLPIMLGITALTATAVAGGAVVAGQHVPIGSIGVRYLTFDGNRGCNAGVAYMQCTLAVPCGHDWCDVLPGHDWGDARSGHPWHNLLAGNPWHGALAGNPWHGFLDGNPWHGVLRP